MSSADPHAYHGHQQGHPSHAHSHDHSHGHAHAHIHHAHPVDVPHPPVAPPLSVLRMSLGLRLAIAAVAITAMWAIIWLGLRPQA